MFTKTSTDESEIIYQINSKNIINPFHYYYETKQSYKDIFIVATFFSFFVLIAILNVFFKYLFPLTFPN